MPMNTPSDDREHIEITDEMIDQGRALVRAIVALETIEPYSHFEMRVAELFQAAFDRQLQDILDACPPGIQEEILRAGENKIKIIYACI
jgi:hypothetical protein